MLKKALHLLFTTAFLFSQNSDKEVASKLQNRGLNDLYAYEMLKELTSNGHRFSGTSGYEKAVTWSEKKLIEVGADSVWLQPVMIPRWMRGKTEKAFAVVGRQKKELNICALGGSVATPKNGIAAEVIEVRSLNEVQLLGDRARGKIIFYNRPFDKTKYSQFEAYSGAVDQRGRGAIEAAKVGAVAVLVRSMTNAVDHAPHTGAMRYDSGVAQIPAAAISTLDANYLSEQLKSKKNVRVEIRLDCKKLSDVPSYSVIGEMRGSEHPEEIILVGGHLDSWDKGTGAHDDGSGVVQSIEVIRLMKELQIKPKRTIRCVLFANEENGLGGGRAYAVQAQKENAKHIAAIESDAGGFSPRGFGVKTDSVRFRILQSFAPLLSTIGADLMRNGGGGADISELDKFGTALIGLIPDQQRYFDYHHSDNDTIDKVHPRELELGAIAMTILVWAIAENGL